jgi:aminoglycoside phosphotransferase (APT) family kinase protein
VKNQHLPGAGPITSVCRLTDSGSQNNIFQIDREGASMVLRRPPEHLRANSNDIMQREATVLSSLAGSEVPHPILYASCGDVDVIGVCFNVMSLVDGFTPHGALPDAYGTNPSWREAMAFEIIDVAAALALVNPVDVGLAEFGRPDGWVERQVARWRSQLDGYGALEGYVGSELPAVDEIGRWLQENAPREYHNGIIHGDLQFANVMFDLHEPKLLALIDWELSTLGDPLLDLGWILTSWDEPGDPPDHDVYVQPFEGFPSRSVIIERYLARTGRSPELVRWYFVLACFKLGILVEGTWARAQSGKASMIDGVRLHRAAMWNFAKAAQLIGVEI